MQIAFLGLPTDSVENIRRTGRDAYGNAVERHVSDGQVYPCRHCLEAVSAGEEYLILAHRPFLTTNPYAETGPIFLCADSCQAAPPTQNAPTILCSPQYLVRGYTADERILYGTGSVVPTDLIAKRVNTLLSDPSIAFVDVRSAANNCFQCRARRVD